MSFLHPAYLWGLLTLAIPLAVHLLSRKEGKVIRVGSLRHIEESNTSQFKSIRLNEILLLLLRMLMISALVLFLSGTQCTSPSTIEPARWLVLEPGVENEPGAQPLIDSLSESGYETRRLSSGFPNANDNIDLTEKENYWSLVDEMAALQDRNMIVLAYNRADRFIGKRRPLPANAQWIVVDRESASARYPLNAVQMRGDSARVQVVETTRTATTTTVAFVNNKPANTSLQLPGLDSVSVNAQPTLRVVVQGDKGFEKDRNLVVSALNVIGNESGVNITIENGDIADADWAITLSKNVPALRTQHIYFHEQENGSLFETTGPGNYRLTKRLTNEVALKENLVINLASILLPDTKTPDRRDLRVLDERMAWSAQTVNGTVVRTAGTDIGKYLLIAFLVLWLAERATAWIKNQ